MSVIKKLITIQSCKENIKQAITDKGVDMTNVAFTDYATKISEIQTGGGGGAPEGGSADYLELRANLRDYQSNVDGVPNGAFIYCYDLTSIDLPNCKYVGNSAFEDCNSLQTVNIPNAEGMGENAFKGCPGLTSIDLPNCKYVGQSAFEYCSSLQTVNIPKLTEIPANMFKGCGFLGHDSSSSPEMIGRIDLPSVQIINDSAFYMCFAIQSISAPNLTRIGSNAFNRCGRLTTLDISGSYWCDLDDINAFEETSLMLGGGEIHVPNSSLSKYQNDANWSVLSDRFVGVGDADKTILAFDNGRLYGDTVVLRDNFTDFLGIVKEDVTSIDLPNCLNIGGNMFMSCNLQSIDLPNCLEIGDTAFSQNTQLSSVNLPKCEIIGHNAFSGSEALTSIDLPNIKYILNDAFAFNMNLKTITIGNTESVCILEAVTAFEGTSIETIYVPNNLVGQYKSDMVWGQLAHMIVGI